MRNTWSQVTTARGDATRAYFAGGTLPGEFYEIEHLSLSTMDDSGNPAPLNGFIRPKRRAAEDYRLVSTKPSGKELTFSTTAVDGVNCGFEVTFEKLTDFAANPPRSDEVILRGKLTKLRDRNTFTETDVNFMCSAGVWFQ